MSQLLAERDPGTEPAEPEAKTCPGACGGTEIPDDWRLCTPCNGAHIARIAYMQAQPYNTWLGSPYRKNY